MARDPVLIHSANAVAAAERYGVPASVLLGLLSVEGGTGADGRPVAPGDGAGPPSYGQFTYGTGKELGIQFGDSRSEVFGVARYLLQLGYKENPERALARYNGGGSPPASSWQYATNVETKAKTYSGFDKPGATGTSSNDPGASSGAGASLSAGDSSAASSAAAQHGTWVHFGVLVALVVAAVALIGFGAVRVSGIKGRVHELASQAAGA